ncbi:hypothetical protein CVT24_000372, partial [Panaeolus cyanescens]
YVTFKRSYFTVIQAGSINFRVALDTASSDIWLVSSDCNSPACTLVPRYPLSYGSPTFGVLNSNTTVFQAQYADSTFVSGFVAKESFTLSSLTVPDQAFGIVKDSNVSLTNQISGILGLGFPRLSSIPTQSTNSTPFFARLAQEGLLEYPLFGLSLARNSSGSLTLVTGAVDSSVVTNVTNIGWNKVAQFSPFLLETNASRYLQWAIPLSGFSVNGSQFTPSPTYASVGQTHSLALFDVGAPGIYGPYQDVSRIYSLIEGSRLVDASGVWAIPCDTNVPMSFAFGSKNYTLLPTDYILGPAAGNPNLCLSWPRALPPSADGIDWQMGSAFLRTVYSIYSFGINGKEPPLIGLYSLHNETLVNSSPQDTNVILSFLSANSATIQTTLPNFLLPTPTFTTPPYTFNTSVPVTVGGIVTSGLANSTYSALFRDKTAIANTSAFPTITPAPLVTTLLVTNPAGDVSTSVSTHSIAAVTLGLPPGWSGADRQHLPSQYNKLLPAFAFIISLIALL